MSSLLSDVNNPASQSLQHTIQRHHEVLRDYTRDFNRTKASATQSSLVIKDDKK